VPTAAAFGSWRSPLGAERLARGAVGLSQPWPARDGGAYWVEGRPGEGGRSVLVRRDASGVRSDVTPPGFDVRTRVHEYGGGAWLPCGEAVVFSNFADQRLYRQHLGGKPAPITPEPSAPASVRYADGRTTPDGELLVCVRESHLGADVVNELVVLPTDGAAEPRVVAGGRDFYCSPRISPDGTRLAWIEWDHPRMPWEGCELWLAALDRSGTLADRRRVAGGPHESIWQPEWSPAGELLFVSDRTGWWNLYRGPARPVLPDAAEYGYPQWLFGGSTFAFLNDGSTLCVRCQRAVERLCRIVDGRLQDLELPYTSFGFPCLRTDGERALFIAASPTAGPAVVQLDVATRRTKVLRESSDAPVDSAFVSQPRAIEFATDGGLTAHAFYYPPRNPDFEGPAGARPPLIVRSHGGPTSHTTPALQVGILYWTSRGLGVVDVNYGGSTGYGREYRQRLHEGWGTVDVRDCIAAARSLATQQVDGRRLAIHGGSAGGFTTLCALVFHDDFAAGASYFGIADAETLARDTHKFESRYLDWLIGPYPEAAERYRRRSPIHFVERLRSPVILFQGLDDEVVPPSQAELMVAALRANRVPFAYLPFAGERHGFRRFETIVRCTEAELYFYGRIFGFQPADAVEPVDIENL
jgi:dipeptidyl aminopeptidase/acylaminoacyl peptidase